jgi:hypothetical protein
MKDRTLTTRNIKDVVPILGNCPICGRYKQLMVDHDHTTDLNRGRICSRCNTYVMWVIDHPELLAAGLRYKANPPGTPDLPLTYKQYCATRAMNQGDRKSVELGVHTVTDWVFPKASVEFYGDDVDASYDTFMDGQP